MAFAQEFIYLVLRHSKISLVSACLRGARRTVARSGSVRNVARRISGTARRSTNRITADSARRIALGLLNKNTRTDRILAEPHHPCPDRMLPACAGRFPLPSDRQS